MNEKKECMKKLIEDIISMSGEEYQHADFLKDSVRGRYLREWCVHCDDFKTCEKTAEKLDDCRMQLVSDSQQEIQARWDESEEDVDEAEAGSSANIK